MNESAAGPVLQPDNKQIQTGTGWDWITNPVYMLGLIGLLLLMAGFGLVILEPVLKTAFKLKHKSSDTQNIRQLGIALMSTASASDDQRYPITSDGKAIATTSTQAFDYLISTKELPGADLVYAPGKDKILYSGSGNLKNFNVGYNYMKAHYKGTECGVSTGADDFLPLLWSSGNAPLHVKPGADLILQDTGIWRMTGVTVYYKGNNSSFKKASAYGLVPKFISNSFVPSDTTHTELAP